MKVLRSTLVSPRKGEAEALSKLLHLLDGYLSTQPGFVESYELAENNSLGRVSVWESRQAADHAATRVHTIALKSQIQRHSNPDLSERMLRVTGERHAA